MKSTLIRSLVVVTLVFAVGMVGQDLPEPRKGDTIGWHEVREGETLSGITERYLGDALLWPENHRLNPGIADPDRLTPGQRIRIILAREIAARRADIEQVSRRVEKKPRADDWTNAHVGDQLVEREGLRTYPKSSAELGFDDGSNLVLTENSIVFLREYTSTLRRIDRSLIEVVDGGIDVAVTPKAADKRGRDIEIVLGEVKAKPKASGRETAKARAIKDEQSDSAKLMVYAGATEVESAGVKVNVAKGQGTSVKQGEAPAPPERLLAAPKLLSPSPGAAVSDSLEVSWAAVAKAVSYTLEVCRDEACARLVDRQVGVSATTATTEALPSGPLLWRVTARSASGLDGFPSSTAAFSVARRIAGQIQVDRTGSLEEANVSGAASGLLRLYSDDGDGVPGTGDALVGETRTAEDGRFEMDSVANGTYWIAVDSRSVSPKGTWYEQIAGPAGALCAEGNGGVTTLAGAGPCFGGRDAGRSDDFSSLTTSEHVAKIVIADEVELGSVDLVFSPSVVTTTADDASPQGSLRQFLSNAAALDGEDVMRFVPREAPAGDDRWWTINLTSALPPIDDEVAIDGAAWSPSGERQDTNEGRVSEAMIVGAEAVELAVADRPELEIVAPGIERPFLARSGTLTLRNVAILGAGGADVTSVGKLTIENSVIGAGADLSSPETAAPIAIEVSGAGSAEVSRTFVRAGGSYGILVRSEASQARVQVSDLTIVSCASGSAVRIESNGSVLERVHVSPCGETPGRLGFELKGTKGDSNQTCRENSISASTVSSHAVGAKIRVGAMDNTIQTTLFDRVTDGVELEFVMGFWVPKGNLISRNEWRGFDEPIALTGQQGLIGVRFFEGAASCAEGGWVVDRALDFPGTVSMSRDGRHLAVSATMCPNVTVEAYLETSGDLKFLGSVQSDADGKASGRIELPDGATRIGVMAIDKWNTSSRVSLHEID
jgi:hypothetical protein